MTRSLRSRLVPLVLVLLSCAETAALDSGFDAAAFADPPVTARPWVRWWWPGNDVEPAELRRELGELAARFFGGAEVQAFDAALDPQAPADELARRRSVLSPPFFAHVQVALDEALALGLGLDLTLGSGWPTGGAHVAPAASLGTLVHAETRVTGPQSVPVVLDGPDLLPFYKVASTAEAAGEPLARYLPELAVPVVVLAAEVVGGERSTNWLELQDQLVLDPASVRVLAEAPEVGSSLLFEAPAGDWIVLELYRMPDGEHVSLAAEAEPAFVTDHVDGHAVGASLEALVGTGTGLSAEASGAWRGLFVDSFELECERFFSTDFLAEFAARRGYDLVPWLPAVLEPGADNHLFDGGGIPTAPSYSLSDQDDRVRFDYQQTVSELFVERFAGTVGAWAAARGLAFRLQGYGLNVDVLAALGAATTPEVEQLYAGGTDLFLKLGSSAAHLYGRAEVSAEAFVWPGKDWAETPTLWKAAADKLFAAGINALVYHGYPYRKLEGYGQGGWHAFSSTFGGASTYGSAITETNPYWGDLAELNRYVARVQVALRQGRPDADVLVLYPWFGFPASFTRLADRDELLFNGRFDPADPDPASGTLMALVTQLFGEPDLGARGEWLLAVEPLLADLHAAGYAWDWVNPARLGAAVADDGRVRLGDTTWGAVLLVDVPWLAPETATQLAELAAADVPVALIGLAPTRQPGLAGAVEGDATVGAEMARLLAGPRVAQVAPDGLPAALEDRLGVPPGVRFWPDHAGIRHVRRALPNGELVFFSNPARDPAVTAVDVPGGCAEPAWLDPWTGRATAAARDFDGTSLALALAPYGSALLHCGTGLEAAELVAWTDATPQDLTAWTLAVPTGAAGEGWSGDASSLPDWRDVPELAHAEGPGRYDATVDLPSLPTGARVSLDLGWVDGVAEVSLNGQSIGRARVPPFVLDVTAQAREGRNTVTVEVIAPLRNAFVARGVAGDPGYRQFAGRPDALAPVGLRGPVTLTVEPLAAE